MNKRGNVHIDWVISIAIFLTFIIILLAFIKPSYKPSFEGDVLVNMVLKEFNERAEWEINKTFLNLDECDTASYFNFDLEDYISDVKTERFKVLDKDGKLFTDYSGSLTIRVNSGSSRFWILTGMGSGPAQIQGDPKSNPAKCNKIGAANPIVFKGIDQNQLTYEKLEIDKLEKWNFPQFRHFRIKILKSNGDYYNNNWCFADGLKLASDCREMSLPEEIPVYSANIGNILLKDETNREQVILNIEVW